MPELLNTSLDHVGLSVQDLPALVAWYVSAFGLVEESDFSYAIGSRQVKGALLASQDGWRLELQQCDGSVASPASTPLESLLHQGLGHFCLRVHDLDAAFALLVERGAATRIRPMSAPLSGVRIGYLADPEGNLIELLEQLETAGV